MISPIQPPDVPAGGPPSLPRLHSSSGPEDASAGTGANVSAPDARPPVLVTGATSHTGERVVAQLLAQGARVRILTRDAGKLARLGMDASRLDVRQGDLTAPWTLWEALSGCRALLNIAHVRYSAVCVRACRAIGVRRLIVMSSTRRFTRWPCETSRAVNRGESAVRGSGLDWTILRSTMIYGGPRDNNITRIMRWVARHRWIPLVGGGRTLIQPVYVDDLAGLIVRALDHPAAAGHVFTVGAPEPISYRALIEEIARLMNKRIWLMNVPASVALAAGIVLEKAAPRLRIRAEQVRRLQEDKAFDIGETCRALDFHPRPVRQGLRDKMLSNPEFSPLLKPVE